MNNEEREIMEQHLVMEMAMAGIKRHLCKGSIAMLVLIFLGCATAPPQPVIIKHQNAPLQEKTAVSRTQSQKDTVEGESAAFVKQAEITAAIEDITSTASNTTGKEQTEDIPEGVIEEPQKSIPDQVKNNEQEDVSPKAESDEMSAEKIAGAPAEINKESVPSKIIVIGNSDTKRYHLPGMPYYDKVEKYHRVLFESEQQAIENGYYKAGTKRNVGNPKRSKKESIRKPDTALEMKKDISEPVKNQEQKEVSPDTAKSDTEKNETIQKDITEETPKNISDQVKNDEQKDVSSEDEKNDKEQEGNIQAGETQEVKTESEAPVEDGAKKEIPRGTATRIDDAQVDEIMDGVKEELKSDIHEQVYEQVKERVREEIPDELKKMGLSFLPEWIKRIRIEGDVRLRYEHDQFDKNNGTYARPDNWQQMNTTIDHDYFRYRARIGAAVPVNDKVEAIFRLSTGNDSNPISTNSTMGDYMNRDRVYFDLAYIKWQPWSFLTFEGGRIPNPWFYSDLVWSPNLNFEGVALKVNTSISELWTTFLTVGAFPLQQDDLFQRSKYLAAGQLGLERKQPKGISAKIGAAYYNFNNITGEMNDIANPNLYDWTAPLYQQKGNTLYNIAVSGVKTALASEFKEFNVTANLDIGFWDPVHIVFLGDYVRNLGFNMTDVVKRTGYSNAKDIDGYQIGVSLGYPKIQELGQWKAYLYYKFLGADAVVDAFTDSDFHLGGTDAKGWIFGAELGLSKNMWLSTRWLTADEIHGNQGEQFGLPLAIDVLQVDLNVRF